MAALCTERIECRKACADQPVPDLRDGECANGDVDAASASLRSGVKDLVGEGEVVLVEEGRIDELGHGRPLLGFLADLERGLEAAVVHEPGDLLGGHAPRGERVDEPKRRE